MIHHFEFGFYEKAVVPIQLVHRYTAISLEPERKSFITNQPKLDSHAIELFLLRNMSRGKGVGFFKAGNFNPDFILWMLTGGKQYMTFIEPHGLIHEVPASEKVLLYRRIKKLFSKITGMGY